MPEQTLSGTPVTDPTIKLEAVFGTFRVGHSPFVIRYASTFANSQSENPKQLLKELQPVRDRLKARDLKDLSSLMQRDLSDVRVAEELVPYLLGDRAKIGFFPAILAVLVPKGYLGASGIGSRYPAPSGPEKEVDYEGHWKTHRYELNGRTLPLGVIEISPARTDVIVLDGQHRGTAFRYLSGAFDPQDKIYRVFYEGAPPPEAIEADLPVTLIWFESTTGEPINPKLISRQLFVDVNNSAKTVSSSRTILLDDRRVSSVATQQVFNFAAARGFTGSSLSLLHTSFDMDVNLAEARLTKLALTAPEILDFALQWALLGSTTFDSPSRWYVERVRQQANVNRFTKLFDGLAPKPGDDGEVRDVMFSESAHGSAFRSQFNEKYLPVISKMFDELALLAPHYEACGQIEAWVESEGDTTTAEVWERVFCGGEGLYWSFATASESPRLRVYSQAIENIQNRFTTFRAEAFGARPGDVDRVYQAFVTKAFQAGFVMAVDFLAANGDGDQITAADDLITRLNQFSPEQWKAVLQELKPLAVPKTSPNYWPGFRNLLLRMYVSSEDEVLDATKVEEWAEYKALEKKLEEFKDSIAALESERPNQARCLLTTQTAIDEIDGILDRCGLRRVIDKETLISRGDAYLRAKLDEIFGRDDQDFSSVEGLISALS